MTEISEKKRKLPRHIDGRIMIGPMPVKNFFILLPAVALITALIIKYFNPFIFFAGVFVIGVIAGLASEFHHRETGFSILKDVIRYILEGDKYYERNALNAPVIKRFSRNKI
ncbi:MAG: hypothetical protein M1479_08745 [Actinobacteria bacterium]|nr:hypothetical protein [Actinomycetota bacterium]